MEDWDNCRDSLTKKVGAVSRFTKVKRFPRCSNGKDEGDNGRGLVLYVGG